MMSADSVRIGMDAAACVMALIAILLTCNTATIIKAHDRDVVKPLELYQAESNDDRHIDYDLSELKQDAQHKNKCDLAEAFLWRLAATPDQVRYVDSNVFNFCENYGYIMKDAAFDLKITNLGWHALELGSVGRREWHRHVKERENKKWISLPGEAA